MSEQTKNTTIRATSGTNGEFNGQLHVSGLVRLNDIPQQVQDLFNDPHRKVTQVVVFHRDLNTDVDPKDGFFWSWTKIDKN